MKKELYCPKCKKFPEKIIERYLEPIEEIRKWDNGAMTLVDTNIDRNQIMAIGNQIRLSDSDPHLQLDMYTYNTCKNDDPDIIKKCNGVIFKKDKVVVPGLPFIETYLSSDKLSESFIANTRSFLSHEGTLLRIFF